MSRSLTPWVKRFKFNPKIFHPPQIEFIGEILQPFPIFIPNYKSPDWKVPNSLIDNFAFEEEMIKSEEEYVQKLRDSLGFGLIGENDDSTN